MLVDARSIGPGKTSSGHVCRRRRRRRHRRPRRRRSPAASGGARGWRRAAGRVSRRRSIEGATTGRRITRSMPVVSGILAARRTLGRLVPPARCDRLRRTRLAAAQRLARSRSRISDSYYRSAQRVCCLGPYDSTIPPTGAIATPGVWFPTDRVSCVTRSSTSRRRASERIPGQAEGRLQHSLDAPWQRRRDRNGRLGPDRRAGSRRDAGRQPVRDNRQGHRYPRRAGSRTRVCCSHHGAVAAAA